MHNRFKTLFVCIQCSFALFCTSPNLQNTALHSSQLYLFGPACTLWLSLAARISEKSCNPKYMACSLGSLPALGLIPSWIAFLLRSILSTDHMYVDPDHLAESFSVWFILTHTWVWLLIVHTCQRSTLSENTPGFDSMTKPWNIKTCSIGTWLTQLKRWQYYCAKHNQGSNLFSQASRNPDPNRYACPTLARVGGVFALCSKQQR